MFIQTKIIQSFFFIIFNRYVALKSLSTSCDSLFSSTTQNIAEVRWDGIHLEKCLQRYAENYSQIVILIYRQNNVKLFKIFMFGCGIPNKICC